MSATQLPPGLAFRPGLVLLSLQDEALPRRREELSPAAPQGQDAAPQGQDAAPGQTAPAKPPTQDCFQPQMLFMVGLMVLLFYFFFIRPQQKQEKARKAMLAAVKKNDKVITTSGIHATVVALDERSVTLKIDEKGDVRVKFDRSAIANILRAEGE